VEHLKECWKQIRGTTDISGLDGLSLDQRDQPVSIGGVGAEVEEDLGEVGVVDRTQRLVGGSSEGREEARELAAEGRVLGSLVGGLDQEVLACGQQACRSRAARRGEGAELDEVMQFEDRLEEAHADGRHRVEDTRSRHAARCLANRLMITRSIHC